MKCEHTVAYRIPEKNLDEKIGNCFLCEEEVRLDSGYRNMNYRREDGRESYIKINYFKAVRK